MGSNLGILLRNSKDNVIRNRWLSLATIFVTSIVFTISTFFIVLAISAQRAVKYYETRAQVIVFFNSETPEEEIQKFQEKIYDPAIIESMEYIPQEKALELYKSDFASDPELVETITADTLPPSVGIRAKSIKDLSALIVKIEEEKKTNPYMDEPYYFKDVLDKLKTISEVINYGSIVLIAGLLIITFSLIVITIGFNIMSHKDEIEIMHLVGSSDNFIKTPYIIEGAFYGISGAVIATSLLLIPWYTVLYFSQNTEFSFWMGKLLTDLSLDFLKTFSPVFVIIFYLIEIVIGFVIGSVGSSAAVFKYLNLKER